MEIKKKGTNDSPKHILNRSRIVSKKDVGDPYDAFALASEDRDRCRSEKDKK